MTGGSGCHSENKTAYRLYVAVMVSAACIIVVMCLLSRRNKYCRNVLWGFPGIAIPVDVLGIGSSGYRILYCVVMGSWGADLLQSILNKSLYYSAAASITDAVYFFVFSPTVIILSSALAYFPVFACVDTAIPVLAHLLGLLYTSLMVTSNIYDDYAVVQGCSYRGNMSNRDVWIYLGSRVMTYSLYCLLLLFFFLYFVFDAVHMFVLGKFRLHNTQSDQTVCETYVRRLLRRKISASRKSHLMRDNLWNYLVRGLDFVLPNAHIFYLRYPLPLLGAFVMGFSMIFHLVIFCSAQEYILAEKLLHWLEGFQITVDIIEHILPSTKPFLNRYFHQALSFAKAYEIILPLGSGIGFGLCALFTAYMIQHTHRQIMGAARGETIFLVRSEPVPSLVYRLAATMRFTAFQVAYLVFSWLVYSFMLWSLFSVGLLFYYLFNDFIHFGVHLWSWFMIPMMWGAGVYNLQLFLCKYVFLVRPRGTLPIIRHKWLYNILSYFLFFFNAIFGLVMCMLRLLGAIVFSAVMLFRLDWDIYMRGLEGWDTGYRTYTAYMYMEYAYNNLIMRLFVHLLLESVDQKGRRSAPLALNNHRSSRPPCRTRERRGNASSCREESRRARLRWHLVYTLIRNPTLCSDRFQLTHTSIVGNYTYGTTSATYRIN